jgi:hypothetical protein
MKTYRLIGAALAAVLLTGTVSLPANGAENEVLKLQAPPEIAATAPLPFTGTLSPSFTIPGSAAEIVATPTQGFIKTPMNLKATGLTANTTYQLVWNTSSAAWLADIDPTTVNYRGTAYSKINVVMGTVTTNAAGAFSFDTKVPEDFGGTHDIYLVKDGIAYGKGGFQIDRTVTISPTSGPVGTPITVTYTGMGASLYTAGGSINYDNKYAGQFLALWTRGTGKAVIRASGRPGVHYLHVADAITFQYMNILQSPVPNATGQVVKFKVTKDAGLVKPYISWPKQVTPSVDARTTFAKDNLDPLSTAVATVTPNSGPVLSQAKLQVSGLPSDGAVDLRFSTVVGSRVDCPPGSTTCWKFNPIPVGTGTVSGGTLDTTLTVPDNLGGYHVFQVVKNGKGLSHVPYYVKMSLVEFRDSKGKLISTGVAKADLSPAALPAGSGKGSYVFKQGEAFTISVKGVGWTQVDNTMGVTYDNSYVGYGCGFNSNGYMVIHMVATGEPGTHIIDLWPNLYSFNPSFTGTQYGMAPLLSGFQDSPALALGYQIPSLHFSITVKK